MLTTRKPHRLDTDTPTHRWRAFLARASTSAAVPLAAGAKPARASRHGWQPPPWFAV
jgi:hypothetical protein